MVIDMKIENVKEELAKEIVAHKEQERKLDILNTNFEAFSGKNIGVLNDRCNLCMGYLETAHRYAAVADDIDKEPGAIQRWFPLLSIPHICPFNPVLSAI